MCCFSHIISHLGDLLSVAVRTSPRLTYTIAVCFRHTFFSVLNKTFTLRYTFSLICYRSLWSLILGFLKGEVLVRTKYIYSLHKILHKLHFRPRNSEFEGNVSSCITHSILLNTYIFSSSLINYMLQGMTKCFPKVYFFLNAKWLKSFSMILDFCILLELRGGFINLKDSLRPRFGKL